MAAPVGYVLLCGQAVLLLANLLLLRGASRGLPHNGTDTEEPGPPAAWAYSDPRAPLVLCTHLPEEFVECEDPVDHGGNATAQQELGHGCVKVHWTLFHNYSALLLFPGLLRCGSILPGPHGHRRGEAADTGRPGHLVVRGSDSPHHWWADAQRRQQLVHRVLSSAEPALEAVNRRWTPLLLLPHRSRILPRTAMALQS
ncbi:TM2 domain-containing protein 2 isoform X2 [Cuculus canorus]|uniref:TM2 domain-containing protein 2 isoform X2 n=1 Tax=Cuculus canorus TaxID=55661 RepID=UPI0023AB2B65|nr:TM2 domain-containing protein 2 isoform X2 [Cuculus canorus]